MVLQKIENNPCELTTNEIPSVDRYNFSEIPFVRHIIEGNLGYLDNFILKKWSRSFAHYVVFGIGGSSLGGQALKTALARDFSINFCDNVDPIEFSDVLKVLDLDKTGFLVISKSGETMETLCQMLIAIGLYKRDEVKYHFTAITENKRSSLSSICADYSINMISHPSDIGGRFSVLSPTGMVVANLMNLKCRNILEGAREAVSDLNSLKIGTKFIVSSYFNGISDNVIFSYSDRLYKFAFWVRQLFAESTGKEGKGITPIVAKGAVDQHSQLQLYLGGAANKNFTFFVENFDKDIKIPECCKRCSGFSFLEGKTMRDLMVAEAKATAHALCEKNLPVRTFFVEDLDERSIGYLFMHFMLQTLIISNMLHVNPFDQPQVERGKNLAKNILMKI